jgi:hypothetical protein
MADRLLALAATRLLAHIDESGAHAYLCDVYGPGLVYRSMRSIVQVEELVREPSIENNNTLFNTGDRAAVCGELAYGVLTARPHVPLVVLDLVAADGGGRSLRCTAWHGGGEPSVQSLVLVPTPAHITERLPAPIADDDATCARVTRALEQLLATDALDRHDRRVYYVDSTKNDIDEATSYELVEEAEFTEMMATLERMVVEQTGEEAVPPLALRKLKQLQASHDPRTHVVAWLKIDAQLDVIWLVARHRTAES